MVDMPLFYLAINSVSGIISGRIGLEQKILINR